MRRVGGERPLMVGDRLDTDIEGAHAIGVDSLLVMTGVTGLEELVAATPRAAADLHLARPGGAVRGRTRCRSETASVARARRLDGHGRATAGSTSTATGATPTGGGWRRPPAGAHLDETGTVVDVADTSAARPVRQLGAE